MNIDKMMKSAAVVLMITLAACFGGNHSSSAGDTLTAAQFHDFLTNDTAFTDLSTAQQTDAKNISRIGLIGHVPGTTTAASTARSTMATPGAVDNTDYGICPDMGQYVASSLPPNITHDTITGNPINVFKQCTGNKYIVDSETGKVATVPAVWFSGMNCTGTAIQFEAASVFDRPTLQGGIVFKSGADGAVLWVKPLSPGATPQQLTSHSNWNGSCVNSDLTSTGYEAVPNVTDGTEGSGAPTGGVPNTYIFD